MYSDVILCDIEESLAAQQSEYLGAWSEMREQGIGSDAILQTEDGGSFAVHKCIMAVCSRYFRALFTSKLSRKSRTQFTIPGVGADMMRLIIKFAYTGSTEVNQDNIISLMPAADQFNIMGMLSECTDFLLERMDIENCIGFREFARIYFNFELEKAANRFMLANFLDVVEKSEEFLDMSLEEVVLYLNSDRINVKNEELVWEAGLKWIDHKPRERRRHIASLMSCVRLGLLDTQYFMEKVKTHKYVENNESCKPKVIETLRFLYDLEIIDQQTNTVETPSLAIPRIPHSILFSIGGWSGGLPTNLIETYDTKADRWIQVYETDPAGPRAYHKLAVIGFNIYVVGGFDGNNYFSSCRCFNAHTKQWRDVAPMNTKRCYVSVACHHDHIYAIGGYNGHYRQNTVERYDHFRNQWTFVAPMQMQRSDASATIHNNRIYVIGGFDGTECLSSGEIYNPFTDQWTLITQSMRQRRSGVSIISHHGHIYTLGGFNGISRLANGEKYDPKTDQWTAVPDMFHPRSNFAIEVMDDMIFVIGGFNGMATIFHVECYNRETNEWYEATDMNNYRSALAACVVPGLPNVNDYVHQNRHGLMEEKRQRLQQQRAVEGTARVSSINTQFRQRPVENAVD